jgi:hypothetical protein
MAFTAPAGWPEQSGWRRRDKCRHHLGEESPRLIIQPACTDDHRGWYPGRFERSKAAEPEPFLRQQRTSMDRDLDQSVVISGQPYHRQPDRKVVATN